MSDPTNSHPVRGHLGLGSNMGDRLDNLSYALKALGGHGVSIERVSSVYETAPVGEFEAEQPSFLNAVVAVATELGPLGLLELCKRIEVERGRERGGPRHGPRLLDIDILLLGEEVVAHPLLEVPHPALTERRFVLEPLLELEPRLLLPDGSPAATHLAELPDQGVRRASVGF